MFNLLAYTTDAFKGSLDLVLFIAGIGISAFLFGVAIAKELWWLSLTAFLPLWIFFGMSELFYYGR